MRIIAGKKFTKLVPEQKSDLLAIAKILRKRDVVTGETTRSILIDKGGRKEKVRKKFRLSIEVDGVEIEHGRLRIKGRVLSEVEWIQRFSHHTLEVDNGYELVLERPLLESERKFLQRFVGKREPVLACIVDDRECSIYRISDSIEEVARITRKGGKMFEQREDSYFSEIVSVIEKNFNGRLIVAGPGFAREKLSRVLEEKGMKNVTEGIAHTGIAGLREVLRRGMVDRVSKELRIGEETRLVEEFFERIARNERVVYGKENVKKAMEMGAVETLLISDEFLSDEIVEIAERMGSKVEIISSSHDEGKRFLEFGGYGAFLRYDMKLSG